MRLTAIRNGINRTISDSGGLGPLQISCSKDKKKLDQYLIIVKVIKSPSLLLDLFFLAMNVTSISLSKLNNVINSF